MARLPPYEGPPYRNGPPHENIAREDIREDNSAVIDILKVLGHDLRLKLICILMEKGEKSVGELEILSGIGQPGLSQQLGIIRKSGLVRTRRKSKLVFYSLVPAAIAPAAQLLGRLTDMKAGATPPAPGQTGSAETSETGNRKHIPAAAFARIL